MKLLDLILETPYLSLDPIFYQEIVPTPLENPKLVSMNPHAARLIGLDPDQLVSGELEALLNGTLSLSGSRPFAMCYAGHQFGFYVPRLGDGRAINLGRINGWNLQLKGSGQTLYSRQGDGRAVLRSSIREYLISEAMHALGIPTTRALAIISSDEKIAREGWEKGSIVLRMSPSWIRFGTFEFFFHSNRHDKLKDLADFLLHESYPHLIGSKEPYLNMYAEIVKNTAEMIAHWQSVGFNHGVMNTDNMSASGLTIDYGPYAFMDIYDSGYICNHTDHEGRYSFDSQPGIGYWNLAQLGRSLSPLIPLDKLEIELDRYPEYFKTKLLSLYQAKLGLDTLQEGDPELFVNLLNILENGRVDMTPFFRALSRYDGERSTILSLTLAPNQMDEWLDIYEKRLESNRSTPSERHTSMLRTNPKYVLKNYILQEAIAAAENDDFSLTNHLLRLAQDPFGEHEAFERFAQPTPLEHRNLKLSCSS